MTRTDWTALLVILAAAAVLRLALLGHHSLWHDEVLCFYNAESDFATTLRTLARENQPPLYHLLLGAWMQAVGRSPRALRLFSALAGLAAVALAFALGRETADTRTGHWTAAWMAVAPVAVFFSREATMYSLFLALTLGAAWAFARWRRAPTPGVWAIWTALKVAGLYVHYFFGLTFVAEAACLAATRAHGRRWAGWLGAHALVAVAFAPWVPILKGQMARVSEDFWVRPLRWLDPANAFRQWTLWIPELDHPGWNLMIAPAALLAAGAVMAGLVRAWRERRDFFWMGFSFLAAPMAALLVFSLISRPLFSPKYLMASAPWMFLMGAWGLTGWRRRGAALATMGALVVLSLTALGLRLAHRGYGHPDYRSAADFIRDQWRPGDRLAVRDPGSLAVLNFYLNGSATESEARYPVRYDLGAEGPPPFWQGVEMFDETWFVAPPERKRAFPPTARVWFVTHTSNAKPWEYLDPPDYPLERSRFLTHVAPAPALRYDTTGVIVLRYDPVESAPGDKRR